MSFLHTKSFYYKVALLTPIAVAIQMMLGSFVQGTGAGLSCPDWPTCQGQIIPQYNTLVYIEFIHRLFASFVSVLILLLLYLTYVHRNEIATELFGENHKEITKPVGHKRLRLMFLVTLLLAIQVIFGGLTVLLHLDAIVVMIHLGVATAILVGTIFIYFDVKPYAQ